jgi:hypothetical protein
VIQDLSVILSLIEIELKLPSINNNTAVTILVKKFMYLKKSFSLIELLITLGLVMIIVAFTIPRTTFFARILVHVEINKLYALFSYLQQRAFASNEEQEVSFNLSSHTYQFKTVQGAVATYHLLGCVQFGACDHVKGPPSAPTRPIDKAATFPLRNNVSTVVFLPNGKITPGTVYLIDGEKRYLGALTCPISQVSYIRRYTHDGQRWNCW